MALPDESLSRAKRVLVRPSEDDDLAKLVANIAKEMGTTVKLSHLLRASLKLLQHAAPDVLKQAPKARLLRPPNEQREALDEFEQSLAEMLLIAFKKAPHMR